MSFYLTERMSDALVLLAENGSQQIGLSPDGGIHGSTARALIQEGLADFDTRGMHWRMDDTTSTLYGYKIHITEMGFRALKKVGR